jgi:signal transduction histidine kinase
MDLLATVLTTTAAIELFAALLFALAFVRRPADRESGVAAVLCISAFEHAAGSLFALHAKQPAAALAAERVAGLGLGLALAMGVHFALAYRGKPPSWRALAAGYAVAAWFAVLALRGRLSPTAAQGVGAQGLFDAPAYVAAAVAAASMLVLVAREYIGGRRGALGVVVGTAILLAAMINDVGVASGAFASGYMADAGLAAFVIGIATMPSARYAAVTQELERSTEELRSRTHELRRSYQDLRTAQEELVKKEQLAVVGELAAVIAHEVRNPLAIIANAVSGLRKHAISREDHATLLGILDEETSRLNRLVTDLLRYARPVNVQRSNIGLGDLLERALSLANTGAKSIRRELKVEAHEARMWGDANLLRQVFDNLIDNAVQAMGSAGALTVRVRVDSEDGVDGLAVDIIDTGEGMDTQVRSRALDPFFTTRPSGTGLGLAIVDRIVDAHGGRLAIDSRTGEGTTVTVFLPHGSPSEPPPAPRSRARVGSEPPGSARATR